MKEKDDDILFQVEKKKKRHRGEKMQRREGGYLFSLASAFGMKRFSCFFLFMFLQR
jgi:hypothetical protein